MVTQLDVKAKKDVFGYFVIYPMLRSDYLTVHQLISELGFTSQEQKTYKMLPYQTNLPRRLLSYNSTFFSQPSEAQLTSSNERQGSSEAELPQSGSLPYFKSRQKLCLDSQGDPVFRPAKTESFD